jgi:Ulp1 family protease
MWGIYNSLQARAAAAAAAASASEKAVDLGGGLTLKDIASAAPGEWLNDTIINMAMACVQRASGQFLQQGQGVPVHLFGSFMNLLYTDKPQNGVYYAAVRRHTLQAALRKAGQQLTSVLDCRYLIAPCHLPAHWVLVVADLQ